MTNNFTPIKTTERIQLLDALRGLAIFGILMVNMPLMYAPISKILAGMEENLSTADMIGESFIRLFFEGKFYVLFSMLFGYGFYIFLSKSTPEKSILPTFRRRLFFLFLFGLTHVVLLWAGDILVFYALFGFLLILFRNSSNKKIIGWSIAFTSIPSLLSIFGVLMMAIFMAVPQAQESIQTANEQSGANMKELIEQAYTIYSTGSFSDIMSIRIDEYLALLPGLLFFYPVVMGMFLLGFYAARRQLIAQYQEHLPMFRKIFRWILPIGLLTSLFYTYAYIKTDYSMPDAWSALSTLGHTLSGILLAIAYASAMVLLFANGKMNRLFKWLSPVGQMALTNYLMHSFITAILFHAYGFGLFGKISVWEGIGLTVLIFLVQIPLSKWWLSKFMYGPLEWVWRSLTYLKLQPFKRQNSIV